MEEGKWGFWGVIKKARDVSEDGMSVRPNQWQDAEQRVGERGVGNEIDRHRRRFVREGELTSEVIRCGHF